MGSSCRSLLCHPFRILAVLVLATGLSACGSDGKDGAQGPPGPQGPPGESAIDTSSVVPVTPFLDLSNTVSVNNGTVTIHFFLKEDDASGAGIDVTQDAYEMRVYVSELVPGTDAEGNRATWHQRISERGTPADGSALPGTLTLVDADTGEYTYVCDTKLAVPASGNVFRATVRARWRETIDGERIYYGYPVNASYDFLESGDPVPAGSGTTTVSNEACASCHGAFYLAEPTIGHGGGYTEASTCVHCHNPDYQASHDPQADLPFLIHRIHDAGVFDSIGDFSDVTYPQEINTCAKCHNGPDADLAYTIVTRSNCGSCHADVDFVTGTNHAGGGGFTDDADCTVCHRPLGSAGDVEAAHNPAPAPADVPEFNVTITMDDPANGEYYVAGETPVVTVTLTDSATDTPVAGTVYTTAQDAAGSAGGGLHTANLFVYGPRSNAVPVLTTDSTTDPAMVAPPTQGHALFTGGADAQVITDGTGFKYQLMDNIGDLEPGTYMVRFEGADYGGVSSSDYVTSSSAVINFQVGTADVEHKRSGDACTDCHGDTIMHLTGSHAHHAQFNTDECLACHDLSGNHGDYIGNRVHAVHRASITGDLLATAGGARDWSEVTYPQAPNYCFKCHTDSDTEIPVTQDPNEVACGGCHGTQWDKYVSDYPPPMGYPDPEAYTEQVVKEISAANHMYVMAGATVAFDATTTNPNLDTYTPRSCTVCHGPGAIADPEVTHNLKLYPPPAPEEDL